MIVQVSQDDINRSIIVDPAWYRVNVKEIVSKPSKDNQSTNHWVSGTIICDADNGDTKFANVPTPGSWLFNSKAMSNFVGFASAVKGEKVEPNERFRLEDFAGKELEVFIDNDTYNNQVVNRIPHKYRAAKSQSVTV